MNAIWPVTVSIASGPSGATLGGTVTTSLSNGYAILSNLSLARAGSYKLSVKTSDPLVSGATTKPLIVSGTTTKFLDQPPPTAVAGDILPDIRVALTDITGAIDPTANGRRTCTAAPGRGRRRITSPASRPSTGSRSRRPARPAI